MLQINELDHFVQVADFKPLDMGYSALHFGCICLLSNVFLTFRHTVDVFYINVPYRFIQTSEGIYSKSHSAYKLFDTQRTTKEHGERERQKVQQ